MSEINLEQNVYSKETDNDIAQNQFSMEWIEKEGWNWHLELILLMSLNSNVKVLKIIHLTQTISH